jgi:hypothetical protein
MAVTRTVFFNAGGATQLSFLVDRKSFVTHVQAACAAGPADIVVSTNPNDTGTSTISPGTAVQTGRIAVFSGVNADLPMRYPIQKGETIYVDIDAPAMASIVLESSS